MSLLAGCGQSRHQEWWANEAERTRSPSALSWEIGRSRNCDSIAALARRAETMGSLSRAVFLAVVLVQVVAELMSAAVVILSKDIDEVVSAAAALVAEVASHGEKILT